MVIGNFSDVTIKNLINQMSTLTTFIQAIGGLILLYIIFNIINSIINKGKRKELKKIRENLEDIKKLLSKKEIKNKKKK